MEALLGALPMAVTVLLLGGASLWKFGPAIEKKIDRSTSGKAGEVSWSEGPQTAAPSPAALPTSNQLISVATEPPLPSLVPPPMLMLNAAGEQVAQTIRDELALIGEPMTEQVERVVRALASVRLAAAHEHNYRVIFPLQLRLLEAVNEWRIGTRGQAKALLAQVDDDPTDASFDLWIRFLLNTGYIAMDSDMGDDAPVRITPMGNDFLLYLIANRLPLGPME